MMAVSPAKSVPTQSVAALSAGLTALAEELFQLDTLPELALAKEPDRLTGKSAAVAREAVGTAASLWDRYPVLKEAVEAMQAASVDGDRDEVERLLGAKAIALPDGTKTGAGPLLA